MRSVDTDTGTAHAEFRARLQATLGSAYTLERELGGGGMSRVFVAEETALSRRVVVKLLAPELAEGLSAERFAREIRFAARLQEPHIVPVLTAGVTSDELPYYTMPFVDGASLRSRLADGPVPVPEATSILRDVAKALAYAHTQGVVHRDIKPENVLLSSGTAVVTDFGIAKALRAARMQGGAASGGTVTSAGMSLGTPAYMAPEQVSGDAVDARADVYAWGVVAYELLAGRHPFATRTSAAQLFAAHLVETPSPLSSAHAPAALAALVARCLAKAPDERPASGGEVVAALESAAAAASGPSIVKGRRTRLAAALALGASLAAAIAVTALRVRPAKADAPPLVAVLPFESEGPGADPGFADGLSDAITDKLARLGGLRVIDRKSVLSVTAPAASPQRTGRLLGAEYVLRAAVQWATGADGHPRVQVTPMLVRVADGTTRWAGEPQVVTPSDPFAVQASIAADVAGALDVALGHGDSLQLARTATRDTAARAAFERGVRLYATASEGTRAQQELALRQFEEAYRRDPDFADAWGRASFVLQWMVQTTGAPASYYDSAAVLARRALAIDPAQRDAVNSLSLYEYVHGRPDESIRVIERATRAYPSSAPLWSLLAAALKEHGDSAGALRAAREGVLIAPRSANSLYEAMGVLLALRRYREARDVLARWRALTPDAPGPLLWAGRLADAVGDTDGVAAAVRDFRARGGVVRATGGWLRLLRRGDDALRRELGDGSPATFGAASIADSLSYYWEAGELAMTMGKRERTRALLDSAERLAYRLETAPDADPLKEGERLDMLAWLAAARGDRPAATATLARAAVWPPKLREPDGIFDANFTCASAEVYALLGDAAAMYPRLERCLAMPNGYHVTGLTEPAFLPYRTDPRFHALASRRPGAVHGPE